MRTFTTFLFACLFVTSTFLQVSCSSDGQAKDPKEKEETPAIPVEATTVTTGDISAFFTGTATLEAEDEALVVAKAGGIVTQLFVEEGQYVQAGAALAKLDDERLAVDLERAEANLTKQLRVFERNEELYKKNLVSAEEYERIKSEYESLKATRDLAQLELTYTTVRAPIAGIVSERLIKTGNMVGTNEPTFRLTQFDPLLAVLHVPERELNKLKINQKTELRLDALPDELYTGHIERISPVVDPMTGTFKVTVEIKNASRKLKPGMFGRVRIVYDVHEQILMVPKGAIYSEDDENAVFVVRDSLVFRHPVEVGYSDDSFTEILSGVAQGDVIIKSGQSSLRDSSKVTIIE